MTTLKDLRTTYNVLDEMDIAVPKEILVHLADLIRQTESQKNAQRISRMTEEDFIRMEGKQKRTLRVNTPDGRLFQKKTSEQTFRSVMHEVDPAQVYPLGLTMHRRPLIFHDITLRRRRIKGYVPLRDGYFLLARSTSAEKYEALVAIDQHLQLDWDIQML